MIVYFIKDTESRRGNGKYHKAGTSHNITDVKWVEKQVKKGNARVVKFTMKDFMEELQEENKRKGLERIKELKENKED